MISLAVIVPPHQLNGVNINLLGLSEVNKIIKHLAHSRLSMEFCIYPFFVLFFPEERVIYHRGWEWRFLRQVDFDSNPSVWPFASWWRMWASYLCLPGYPSFEDGDSSSYIIRLLSAWKIGYINHVAHGRLSTSLCFPPYCGKRICNRLVKQNSAILNIRNA